MESTHGTLYEGSYASRLVGCTSNTIIDKESASLDGTVLAK